MEYSSRRHSSFIPDNFSSLDQVTAALRDAGLESSNLILGIDFTKSNEWNGPTSFAPLIYASIEIVKRSNWQYHVLLIIADGQLGPGISTQHGHLNPQEQATIDSIVAASYYPLSIIMVGVGDGPWDAMQQFDDCLPHRSFDNFQFVNFTNIMSSNMPTERKETSFALAALMEIPYQYKAAVGLRHVNPREVPDYGAYILTTPREVIDHDKQPKSLPQSSGERENVCPICLVDPKDMTFGCGHLTCRSCGGNEALKNCPICRAPITTRVKLFLS